jgi:signal transduction histidine kinase
MPVTVHEEGTPRELDPSVDLAAYRIAQEGLTNILKHAGKDANPQLRLLWGAESLIIQIDNGTNLAEAPGGPALGVGHGLMGLRERAHAVGGHLHAGAHRGVGYRLIATLPFAAPAVPPGVSSTTGPCPCSEGPGNEGKVRA